MPGSLRSEGLRGTLYSGRRAVADFKQWSLEHIAPGRFSFIGVIHPDLVHWPFRDPADTLRAELPHQRQTVCFAIELSSESPSELGSNYISLAGEAILDANNAEDGDFW